LFHSSLTDSTDSAFWKVTPFAIKDSAKTSIIQPFTVRPDKLPPSKIHDWGSPLHTSSTASAVNPSTGSPSFSAIVPDHKEILSPLVAFAIVEYNSALSLIQLISGLGVGNAAAAAVVGPSVGMVAPSDSSLREESVGDTTGETVEGAVYVATGG
jgi:hypothetical protein